MFGFFECIPDYAVACALFDCAAAWAGEHDLETLYGPFNLDYEDSYGILIDGRDRPPALLCGHTPPYYQDFVERYGFLPARGDNLAFAYNLNYDTPEMEHLHRLADRLRQRGRIQIRGARLDHWEEEVDAVLTLLNQATAHLVDFIPWQRAALQDMLAQFRQIADPELILFAEVDGTPGRLVPSPAQSERSLSTRGRPAPSVGLPQAGLVDAPPAQMPDHQERAGAARILEPRRGRAALRRNGPPGAGQRLHLGGPLPHQRRQPRHPRPGRAHGREDLQALPGLSQAALMSLRGAVFATKQPFSRQDVQFRCSGLAAKELGSKHAIGDSERICLLVRHDD